jgi:hypothetical protein
MGLVSAFYTAVSMSTAIKLHKKLKTMSHVTHSAHKIKTAECGSSNVCEEGVQNECYQKWK